MSQRPSLPIIHQHRLASPSLLYCLQANTFAHKIHPKTRCTSKVNIVTRLFMSKSRRTHIFCLLSAGRDPSPHVSAAHATSVSPPFAAFFLRKQGHMQFPRGVWISYHRVLHHSSAELYERFQFCSPCHNSCSCASRNSPS